jgi:hypothetical protein
MLVPFSLLPDSVGGILWRWVNFSVYLGALAWWCQTGLPRPLTTSQQAWLFLLVVPLSIGSLNNAQSNPLVVGLILATVTAVGCGRWNLAAACMAGACLLKLYPIAVGLLLIAIHGWRLAGRLILALGIGLILPFLFQHPDYVRAQYGGWLHHLVSDDRQAMPLEVWYRDLRLLCHTCHIPLGPGAYSIVQIMFGALFAGICVMAHRTGREQRSLLVSLLALGCGWMTLFGPTTESCTYILLAPSLAWALLDAWILPQQAYSFSRSHLRARTVSQQETVRARSCERLNYGVLLEQIPKAGLLVSFGLFMLALVAVWFPAGRAVHTLGPQPLAALVFLVCQLGIEFRELAGPSPNKIIHTPAVQPA